MKLRLNIFKKQINKYHFKTKNIRNHYISGAGKGFMTKKNFGTILILSGKQRVFTKQ